MWYRLKKRDCNLIPFIIKNSKYICVAALALSPPVKASLLKLFELRPKLLKSLQRRFCAPCQSSKSTFLLLLIHYGHTFNHLWKQRSMRFKKMVLKPCNFWTYFFLYIRFNVACTNDWLIGVLFFSIGLMGMNNKGLDWPVKWLIYWWK